MKENKYDDDVFFNKYKEMNRSVQGLEGAGEWSQLKQLLPDFEGKRVLDLGCGYGWLCGWLSWQPWGNAPPTLRRSCGLWRSPAFK